MFDVINSLFGVTRTHFQQSINDIRVSDTKEALSELNKVINSAINCCYYFQSCEYNDIIG